MHSDVENEFIKIIEPILKNDEFCKTREIPHHGITRYEHCLLVAYYTYLVTKKFHLNYKEATRGALLHDFFLDEVKAENSLNRLKMHPNYAVANALKYFALTAREIDIIETHMFPITSKPPKYLESWLVDIIDDYSAIKEKCYSLKLDLKYSTTILVLLFINYLRIK